MPDWGEVYSEMSWAGWGSWTGRKLSTTFHDVDQQEKCCICRKTSLIEHLLQKPWQNWAARNKLYTFMYQICLFSCLKKPACALCLVSAIYLICGYRIWNFTSLRTSKTSTMWSVFLRLGPSWIMKIRVMCIEFETMGTGFSTCFLQTKWS